jgi:hypothetical protein
MKIRNRLLNLLPARRRALEADMRQELEALRELADPGELGNLTRPAENARAGRAQLSVVPRAHRTGSALSNNASGSIAVRPASGFLQVSLSKVLRPESPAAPQTSPAEALPIKANDQGGVICNEPISG